MVTWSRFSENGRSNWIWEIAANVLVACFFSFFAYSFAERFFTTFRISFLLLFIKETLDAVFYLCRKIPRQVSFRFFSWMMAIGGTITPLLLRPAGTSDSIAGSTIQYAGLSLQILAILSLNRSFGIVPANRGIKRSGMYRLVRHPLYSAYTIALLGFVINNFTWTNLCLYLLATIFQVVRIAREEEFLSQDEDYLEYAKQTRWKMAPFIF